LTVERHVEITVISGLSGAGRSEAAKALEDLGWYVIDNLPPQLIEQMIQLSLQPGNLIARIALVIDARNGSFFKEAEAALEALEATIAYRLVFLEADDEVLVRRFDATRRRHPLAEGDDLLSGIKEERRAMGWFKNKADLIIDTSLMSSRDLRQKMAGYFGGQQGDDMRTTIVSFGYKYGLPIDADIVLDVRFLPNPHWIEDLRPFDGRDQQIRDYVLEKDATTEFLTRLRDLLTTVLPGYQEEGRHFLTIAVGCTGGRHRSVVLSEEIGSFIREKGLPVNVVHRDVDRSPVAHR
jgi:RNase adapter protein RapZ